MDENNNQTPPPKGAWWFAWIFSAFVLPAILGAFAAQDTFQVNKPAQALACLVIAISLGLHFGSCIKLDQKIGPLIALLFLGGWVLMLVSFFTGCLLSYDLLK